jgi:hypothetical protein
MNTEKTCNNNIHIKYIVSIKNNNKKMSGQEVYW